MMNNLGINHLTDEQIKSINDALQALESAMQPLTSNLTPEERKKYGSVNEQNKLFVNKVNEYASNHPSLKSPDVDWEEFARDFKSRQFLEGFVLKLDNLLTRAYNSKILHDYDNYQDALEDYAYTNFQARRKSDDYETKHRELKQFFQRSVKKTSEEKK